jgi:histone chaperone ASF1
LPWSADSFALYLVRDVTPPGQNQTALGAAASAAVPSANDLDTSDDIEMSGASTTTLNGISV